MNRLLLKAIISPLLAVFLFSSCSDQNINQPYIQEDETQQIDIPTNNGVQVDKELAVIVAERFANNFSLKKSNLIRGEQSRRKGNDKKVGNVITIKDDNKKAVLHLVNYKENGFVVVPADQRIQPILAYSSKNRMPTSTNDTIPSGLKFWLQSQFEKVKHIRGSKQKSSNSSTLWGRLVGKENTLYKIPPEDGDDCDRWEEEALPLMQTTWGQGNGYNNATDYAGCSTPSNGHPWSGCVATAISQIINYHEHDGPYYNFNFGSMPNTYGNSEVALLMKEVGDEVNMKYSCSGSSASVSDMAPAFHDFGYSQASLINYGGTSNYTDVVSDLEGGNPVIFSGFEREEIMGIFPTNGAGHAWVSDGYNRFHSCSGNTYLDFYMNWGWDGAYDGRYDFNNFDPGDSEYNRNTKVVVDIYPS